MEQPWGRLFLTVVVAEFSSAVNLSDFFINNAKQAYTCLSCVTTKLRVQTKGHCKRLFFGSQGLIGEICIESDKYSVK